MTLSLYPARRGSIRNYPNGCLAVNANELDPNYHATVRHDLPMIIAGKMRLKSIRSYFSFFLKLWPRNLGLKGWEFLRGRLNGIAKRTTGNERYYKQYLLHNFKFSIQILGSQAFS
jgi:hypothetical protein